MGAGAGGGEAVGEGVALVWCGGGEGRTAPPPPRPAELLWDPVRTDPISPVDLLRRIEKPQPACASNLCFYCWSSCV